MLNCNNWNIKNRKTETFEVGNITTRSAYWNLFCFCFLFFWYFTVDDGDLRLTPLPGGVKGQGRLDIFYDGHFGQVCDDIFDLTISGANVACRQLGYDGALEFFTVPADFTVGQTEILLDNVSCTGEEATLLNCEHLGWRNHNCQLNEAVAITCVTDQP